jgi:hypothetical protein
MNKLFLFGLAGMLLMTACSKKDNNNNNNTPAVEASFVASGVTDINIERTGTTGLGIMVELKGTTQESVTVAVSGLPSGITCDVSPEGGTPTFTSLLTFKATNAVIGKYLAKITITGKSGAVRQYAFNINVKDFTREADRVAGNYSVTLSCLNPTTVQVVADQYTNNKVIFKGLAQGNDLYALIDSPNHKLTIPSQTYNGSNPFALDGTATYTDNKIEFTLTWNEPGAHHSCNTTLTR